MEEIKFCPDCSNAIVVEGRCEYCETRAVVETCFHCNFGSEPCICGNSPDYNPDFEEEWEEDFEVEDDGIEHYL